MMFCIDFEGKILQIEIVDSPETFYYFNPSKWEPFLKQFLSKNILKINYWLKNIDTISQATISSQACIETVKCVSWKISNLLNTAILSSKTCKKEETYDDVLDLCITIFIILSTLWIHFRNNQKLRDIILLIVIVYFGFLKGYFLDINTLYKIITLDFKVCYYSKSFLTFIGFALISPFILGRFFCGWLCPFGAIMHFTSKVNFSRHNPPFLLHKYLLNLKIIICLSLVLLFLFKININFPQPFFPYLYIFKTAGMIRFILLILIIASFIVPYFWCRYLCPVGGALSLLSLLSLTKYKFTCKDKYCKICIKNCPKQVITLNKKILNNNCIRCGLCKICKIK